MPPKESGEEAGPEQEDEGDVEGSDNELDDDELASLLGGPGLGSGAGLASTSSQSTESLHTGLTDEFAGKCKVGDSEASLPEATKPEAVEVAEPSQISVEPKAVEASEPLQISVEPKLSRSSHKGR